jgi:hypothetical protein
MEDIDQLNQVPDCSRETTLLVADRVARSVTAEQLTYREAELDELWRTVQQSIEVARRANVPDAAIRDLGALLERVHRAHDLVGADEKPAEAARVLQAGMR